MVKKPGAGCYNKRKGGKKVMKTETFKFMNIPKTAAELQAFPEADLSTPFKTAALTMIALCAYKESPEAVHAMLDFLKGPEDLSTFEKQFLKDRLGGKEYKPCSFFKGATPENGYVPAKPFEITVSDNPYSYPEENWATLYVKSSGADSERSIKFRKKPSTGQWFLNDIQCLSDIRVPASADPWA